MSENEDDLLKAKRTARLHEVCACAHKLLTEDSCLVIDAAVTAAAAQLDIQLSEDQRAVVVRALARVQREGGDVLAAARRIGFVRKESN